jgi:hypothetical protein
VQKRQADPAQSHQRRRAELSTVDLRFLTVERIIGDVARQIVRSEDAAFVLILRILTI